jgi:replicative DNA helicase
MTIHYSLPDMASSANNILDSRFICVAAQAGMGKSFLLMDLIAEFSQHYKVLFFDLVLSLSQLTKYVSDDETFQIDSEEHKIYVFGKRFETEEEVAKRVLKEESYMERYNEYHRKKGYNVYDKRQPLYLCGSTYGIW